MYRSLFLFLTSFVFFVHPTVAATLTDTVHISTFGAVGDGKTNDYAAFQQALTTGHRTLVLDDKTYLLDNDTDSSLFLNDVLMVGGAHTVIEFTHNRVPLFMFLNAKSGGVESVHFLYSGVTNSADTFTPEEFQPGGVLFYKKLMNADNYQFGTVILSILSQNLVFSSLSFESSSPGDALHGISFCINIKAGTNFLLRDLSFKDCIIGILCGDLTHSRIAQLVSERRFGNTYSPPGHILYMTGYNSRTEINRDDVIDSITDNGSPINLDGRCLAPLAIKFCDGIVVRHVVSFHPEGLIQSMESVRNSSFENFFWSADGDFKPAGGMLNFAAASADDSIVNNKFEHFHMESKTILVRIYSSKLLQDVMYSNVFDDFSIFTPLRKKDGGPKSAVIDFNGTNNHLSHFIVELYDEPGWDLSPENAHMIYAFRNNSSRNVLEITLTAKDPKHMKLADASVNIGNGNSVQVN